jgi:hypothetical protein
VKKGMKMLLLKKMACRRKGETPCKGRKKKMVIEIVIWTARG